MYMQDIFQHTLKALDQRDPRSAATAPVCNRAEQEGSSPTDDAGTAGVVDSDYDGAPYCSHCGARAAQWCDCGPIAENE